MMSADASGEGGIFTPFSIQCGDGKNMRAPHNIWFVITKEMGYRSERRGGRLCYPWRLDCWIVTPVRKQDDLLADTLFLCYFRKPIPFDTSLF